MTTEIISDQLNKITISDKTLKINNTDISSVSLPNAGIYINQVQPTGASYYSNNILLGYKIDNNSTSNTIFSNNIVINGNNNIVIGANTSAVSGTVVSKVIPSDFVGCTIIGDTPGGTTTTRIDGYSTSSSAGYNTIIGAFSGFGTTVSGSSENFNYKDSQSNSYHHITVLGADMLFYPENYSTVIAGKRWVPAANNICEIGASDRYIKKIYANNLQLAGSNGLQYVNIPSNQIMVDATTAENKSQYTQALNSVTVATTDSQNGVVIWVKEPLQNSSYYIEANIICQTSNSTYTFGGKVKGIAKITTGAPTICNSYGGALTEFDGNAVADNTLFELAISTNNKICIKVYPPSISNTFYAAKYSAIVNVTRITA